LAARSSLFLKRKLCIKVVSIIMNTGPHMHIWYMDYLRCCMAWFGTHPVVYPTFPGDARLKAAKPWLRSLAYVRFANLMVSRATLQHWCSAAKSGIIPQATHIKTPKNHQKGTPPPGGGRGGFVFRLLKFFCKNFVKYINIFLIGINGL
jgi:hypothetical protein